MKVNQILEANFAQNLASWENNRPDHPPEWDNEEFEPTESGFVTFDDMWSGINNTIRQNNNAAIVNIAKTLKSTPQQVHQQIREIEQQARSETQGSDESFYSEELQGQISNLLQSAASGKDTGSQFWDILYKLTDDVMTHEEAIQYHTNKHSEY